MIIFGAEQPGINKQPITTLILFPKESIYLFNFYSKKFLRGGTLTVSS